MTESTTDTKAAYHHGDVPTALLVAVDEIIRERGVAGVSLREAARRIGVSHAAPAHHFGDKQVLLTAFAVQGFERLTAAMAAALDDEPDDMPEARLRAVGLAYVRFAISNPAHFDVMFRKDLCDTEDPTFDAVAGASFGMLAEGIAEWQAAGLIDDADVAAFTTSAWALVHGMATLWLEGPLETKLDIDDPDTVIGAVLDLFGNAFAVRGRSLARSRGDDEAL